MRHFLALCCFCLFSTSAVAQTADWKSFGRPLDDDSKAMRDRYVYWYDDKLDKTVGLDRAVISQSQINDWLRDKLSVVMTLDGTKYDAQVKANSPLFTQKGYSDYTSYLTDVNLSKFLVGNQFKMVAYLDGEPFLTNQGVVDVPASVAADGKQIPASRRYTWQMTARLVLSYLDYRNQPPAALFKDVRTSEINNRFPLQATVELVRVPQLSGGDVIAINALSFNVVK